MRECGACCGCPSSKLVVITLTNFEIFASVSTICSFYRQTDFASLFCYIFACWDGMRQYCVRWFYVHYYHLWQTKSTNCLLGFIIWTFNPLSEGSMFVFEIITSSLEPPVTVMGWKTWFVKLLFYFIEWCVIAAVWGVTTNIDNQVTLSRGVTRRHMTHHITAVIEMVNNANACPQEHSNDRTLRG